jgi:hypothetical protein
MWVSPNHPNPPRQTAAPQESGERVATFPRGDGVELRVNLAEYQGRPYLSFRVWERDQAGTWWPVKGKGCSVRIGECEELADALARVVGRIGQGTARMILARRDRRQLGADPHGRHSMRPGRTIVPDRLVSMSATDRGEGSGRPQDIRRKTWIAGRLREHVLTRNGTPQDIRGKTWI